MKKKLRYSVCEKQVYFSKRYNKTVTTQFGFMSDGATGAIDIKGKIKAYDTWDEKYIYVSLAWIIHDKLCNTGVFDDGTRCTNFQASTILSDILLSEGRYFRTLYWWPMTYVFGGGKCRITNIDEIDENQLG